MVKERPVLFLASDSPRRKQILSLLGLDFKVVKNSIEENLPEKYIDPNAYAGRLSLLKARNIADKIEENNALIIAADTIVVAGKRILGKPTTKTDAFQMLTLLSGRNHKVITGVSIIKKPEGTELTETVVTKVTFYPLSELQIKNYIRLGEYRDKAGSYGIQGMGSLLVEKIEGCYYNVVGLPLSKLTRMLKNFGVEVL